MNFANQMKSIFYREVNQSMSDSMIQMILNENDALILSLETILESEEKY